MKLFKRLKFAFQYNFNHEFIVIPFGDEFLVSRFLRYEDAFEFAKKCAEEQPQFPRPEILVIVQRKTIK